METTPSKIGYILNKLKTKSFSQIIAKIVKRVTRVFFIRVKGLFLKYTEWPMDTSILEQFKVQLRVISPEEISLLSDREYYSKRIWDDRWRQGAQLLGAIWNGQIIEYCWIIQGGSYRDIFDGFCIKLNPGECYLFDYRALKGKPEELRHYRIMKVLVQFVFQLMKKSLPDYDNVCYTVVVERNEKSLFFFRNYFHAELVANIWFHKFLFWKWFNQENIEGDIKC